MPPPSDRIEYPPIVKLEAAEKIEESCRNKDRSGLLSAEISGKNHPYLWAEHVTEIGGFVLLPRPG
jgi:hypothetical protein